MQSDRTVALTGIVLVKYGGIRRTQPRSELLLHDCAEMSPSGPCPFISTNSIFRCKVYDKPGGTILHSPPLCSSLGLGGGCQCLTKTPVLSGQSWAVSLHLQLRAILPPGSLHESRMSGSSTPSLIYTNTCKLDNEVLW